MKIKVNRGRSVRVVVKPATRNDDGSYFPPMTKAYGPTHLLEVPDEEAKFLIERGYATKYEAPRAEEVEKPKAPPIPTK